MLYLYLKAFHVIGVVCWFAGLFYIVRLFIYDVEASLKDDNSKLILQNQLRIMERRLWYGITVPSMVITVVCGVWMLILMPFWLKSPNGWMHLKLGFVVLLLGYHHYCGVILKQLKEGSCSLTSKQLRVWNEVATLLLCGIVLAVIIRSVGGTLITLGILFGIGFLIFALYSKKRNRTQAS